MPLDESLLKSRERLDSLAEFDPTMGRFHLDVAGGAVARAMSPSSSGRPRRAGRRDRARGHKRRSSGREHGRVLLAQRYDLEARGQAAGVLHGRAGEGDGEVGLRASLAMLLLRIRM